MRINGRILRPSSLAERRIMLALGLTTSFRCPRSENPYSLARKVRRLSENKNVDADHLRRLAAKKAPLPDLPDSRSADGEQAA